TSMQCCASSANLRGGVPILMFGIGAMAHTEPRHLEPSSATPRKHLRRGPKLSGVTFSALPSLCRTEGDTLGHHAIADEVPERDQKFAGQGHDHLLARTRGVLGAGPKPQRQGAILLELKESPCELDHAPPHA